jgi:iron uptake system EfeUOB component EfeO/EfeM
LKSRKLLVPIIVVAALSLTACGTNNEKKADETKKTEQSSPKSVSISDGAKDMKQTIADLNAQLKAKDATKVKESGAKLEESWQTFEDDVKAKSSDLYGKVETPLHTIEAGATSSPLDAPTLTKAAKELDGVLSDVQNIK